jgi:hypothetical protein
MRTVNGIAVVGQASAPLVRAQVVRGHYSGGLLRTPGQVVELTGSEFGELSMYGLVEHAPSAPAVADTPTGEPAKGKRK